jgi:hypothetical protein
MICAAAESALSECGRPRRAAEAQKGKMTKERPSTSPVWSTISLPLENRRAGMTFRPGEWLANYRDSVAITRTADRSTISTPISQVR